MKDSRAELDSDREAALEQWVDCRIVTKDFVDAWIWLEHHSWADLGQIGAELVGFSLRQKYRDWLLVVKVLQDDIPRVGFVTSVSPTRCVLKLRTLLREEAFKLVDDRFA